MSAVHPDCHDGVCKAIDLGCVCDWCVVRLPPLRAEPAKIPALHGKKKSLPKWRPSKRRIAGASEDLAGVPQGEGEP